jgi:hypothetical protein
VKLQYGACKSMTTPLLADPLAIQPHSFATPRSHPAVSCVLGLSESAFQRDIAAGYPYAQ